LAHAGPFIAVRWLFAAFLSKFSGGLAIAVAFGVGIAHKFRLKFF
jgi:hypothetical protein